MLKVTNAKFEAEGKLKSLGLIALIVVLSIAVTFLIFVIRSKYNVQELNNRLEQRNLAIEQQNILLTESDDLNKKLLRILSHDMRGPLTNLNMLLELVNAEGISSTEAAGLLQQLQADVLKTEMLLFNVVAWVKNQTSQNVAALLETLAPHEIAQGIVALNATPLKNKQLTVYNRIPEAVFVKADQQLTSLTFRNLLSNAIKFSPSNSAIEVVYKNPGREMLHFGIRDQGRGLTLPEQEIILSGMVTKKGTQGELGTGIGIQIVMESLAKQGGQLWIESTPSMGSTFWFSLPKAESPLNAI